MYLRVYEKKLPGEVTFAKKNLPATAFGTLAIVRFFHEQSLSFKSNTSFGCALLSLERNINLATEFVSPL